MLVSYRWLQEYVDISELTVEELAEKLTRGGVEVDVIHSLNKGMKGVVVGHVLEKKQHPNADKLNVCLVDVGEEEPVQIVCGAPNVDAGQKVAVAKVGAVLPDNSKIKKAKLRGELSQGMICSLQELGIEGKLVEKDYSDGIYVFPSDIEVGIDALEALNLNDHVLELDLTPNRADCLSMLGVAYEVAALLGKDVKKPKITHETGQEKASDYISVRVDETELNPYYSAKMIKNVKIGPSPQWLKNRLVAAGIRPISNVVDVTNYVLLEYGQPLHAFDYDRFGSKEVVVRLANEGEKIVTLDNEERTLKSEHLVITNGEDPMAVAGVMGGASSEVRSDTTTVLLEAAYFAGTMVRKTSRDLGLRSESSMRFEKGIDPNRVAEAAERAAILISELAGGEVLEGIVEANHLAAGTKEVSVSTERINHVLGTDIQAAEVAEIFERLQFSYEQKGEEFIVFAPSRRRDIAIAEDLIEEVARIYGYDKIPTTLPKTVTTPGALNRYQLRRRQVRHFLEGAGLTQAITYSLTSPQKKQAFANFANEGKAVRLSMPMSEEHSILRTSLLPHLLDAVSYNNNRKVSDVALYETGSIFLSDEEVLTKQPKEQEVLAGVLTGHWLNHPWQGERKKVDFFVAKGVLEGLFEVLGIAPDITFTKAEKRGLHPGRTAAILLGGEELGVIGQVHPDVQKEWDINETYVFELDLVRLLEHDKHVLVYDPLPRFPAISRDIALVVDKDVSAEQLKAIIVASGGKLLTSVNVFDLYEGDRLEDGKKSIAFSLTYLDKERTLTDEEVSAVHDKILTQLESEAGAQLRS